MNAPPTNVPEPGSLTFAGLALASRRRAQDRVKPSS
ncbi:MAG: PEP-CTERM sorting domain-containing protein [Paucibacter sp.]|nr:PEP-CTERM sorting domain-containing protein [Roseateles sp.]